MAVDRIVPGAGEESVWDYPTPPRVEETSKHIEVIFNDIVIADTRRALRLLERGHPPVYYIPPGDIAMEHLIATARSTVCPWKGDAVYFTLIVGDRAVTDAAWAYPEPLEPLGGIRDHLAFYPRLMDACHVDGARATPEPGRFYGGWITDDIVGPFGGG